MNKPWHKNVYFLLCLALVTGLSSVRSHPVYGKLDFILLDGRPWWKPWKPMIEQVVQQGEQPIVSDVSTSTVLRAVFAQSALAFRDEPRFFKIDIEKIVKLNSPGLLNVGTLYLLLGFEPGNNSDEENQPGAENVAGQAEQGVAPVLLERGGGTSPQLPLRCVINLRGFEPSWILKETRHWSRKWSEPSSFYEYRGKRGKALRQWLKDNPPDNCTVYY